MTDLLEDFAIEGDRMPVTIHLTTDDAATLSQLGVRLGKQPEEVLVELLRRVSPNGKHGYEVTCDGCGMPFRANRRPLPDQKRWCESCRMTGEPGAARARRFRERRSGR